MAIGCAICSPVPSPTTVRWSVRSTILHKWIPESEPKGGNVPQIVQRRVPDWKGTVPKKEQQPKEAKRQVLCHKYGIWIAKWKWTKVMLKSFQSVGIVDRPGISTIDFPTSSVSALAPQKPLQLSITEDTVSHSLDKPKPFWSTPFNPIISIVQSCHLSRVRASRVMYRQSEFTRPPS